jgi:hypothetical protein
VARLIQKLLIYAIVHFVLTYPAWAPFACLKPVTTLLFFIRTVQQARQNYVNFGELPVFHVFTGKSAKILFDFSKSANFRTFG